MIPAYNSGRHLRTALSSVLAQDPGPDQMQIEVVDDASTKNDPEAVVQELGRGRVDYFRQPENVGHTRNFETCIRRANGRLIHLLHGDDFVRLGFYQRLQKGFEERPDIGGAFCRYVAVDEEGSELKIAAKEAQEPGVLQDWLLRIATGQRLQTPCMVVRREVYEHLGAFDERLRGAEDWEMWVRIAAHYPVWYEPGALAGYRMHLKSKSQRALRTGANVPELRKAIQINRAYLPPEHADRITRTAYRKCAKASLRRSYRLSKSGDLEGGRAQRRAAVETFRSPGIVLAAFGMVLLDSARTVLQRTRDG